MSVWLLRLDNAPCIAVIAVTSEWSMVIDLCILRTRFLHVYYGEKVLIIREVLQYLYKRILAGFESQSRELS